MTGRFVRSAVRAEVRRAFRADRDVDRTYLYFETGLAWNKLERLISQASQELIPSLQLRDGGSREGGNVSKRRRVAREPLRARADALAFPIIEWPVPSAKERRPEWPVPRC